MRLEFSVDWLRPHLPQWEQFLGPLRGRPDLRFLEIGAFEGRSACWLLENILTDPSSHLTVVDLFEPSYARRWLGARAAPEPFEERFDRNIRDLGAQNRVTKCKGRSDAILPNFPPSSFSFVYVDGSHAAEDVRTDAELSWPILEPGGILAFDDYRFCGTLPPFDEPKPAIDAFLAKYEGRYETLVMGEQVWVRKMIAPERSRD